MLRLAGGRKTGQSAMTVDVAAFTTEPASYSMCPLLPTGDGVILEDVDAPPPSKLITLVGHNPSYRGRVVVTGPDVVDLQVGDVVQYRKFVGTRIDVDGHSWMLIREDECVCRLE